jgi:hypothetical protein
MKGQWPEVNRLNVLEFSGAVGRDVCRTSTSGLAQTREESVLGGAGSQNYGGQS